MHSAVKRPSISVRVGELQIHTMRILVGRPVLAGVAAAVGLLLYVNALSHVEMWAVGGLEVKAIVVEENLTNALQSHENGVRNEINTVKKSLYKVQWAVNKALDDVRVADARWKANALRQTFIIAAIRWSGLAVLASYTTYCAFPARWARGVARARVMWRLAVARARFAWESLRPTAPPATPAPEKRARRRSVRRSRTASKSGSKSGDAQQ